MYSIFLIYSFIGGQLGHFHVLAIVTNAAINKGWMYLFGLVLSGYMPRSGIAGSLLLLLLSNFGRVQLCVNPWIVVHQAPVSMGFPRQEYWIGLPCLPPGDLPNPGIKPRSPTLQVDSLLSEPPEKPKNTGMGSLTLLQMNQMIILFLAF